MPMIARMTANILNRPLIARRGRILPAVVAMMVLAAAPAFAQRPPTAAVGGESRTLFEARGVPVDVTASSVTEAKERAFAQGRVDALRKVVAHLAPREDLAKLPNIPASDVIEMVQEFSLANERTSAVRYIAEMNVRFDPDAVRRVMRSAGIHYTEIRSRPMVLLPLYVEDGHAMLFDDGNSWRDAWVKLKDRSPLVPLLLPTSDPEIRPDQAMAKDTAALQALAARYEAAGVIVAKLTANGDNFQIVLTQLRGSGTPSDADLSYAVQSGQSREDALLAAAAQAADDIAQGWIKRNQVDLTVTTQLTALAPVKDLREWLRIRERLREVPLIERVELQAITRDRAQVTLRYAGDQGRLQSAIAEQNLALSQQGGVWILSARSGGADATP